MVHTDIDAFLIEFKNSYNQSTIIGSYSKELVQLAAMVRSRKKRNTHDFTVYRFDRAKRKFVKINIETFIKLTDYCAELNVVLTEIYK